MLTGRKKMILTICMFLGISFLLACLSLKKAVEVAGDNREQLPIRSFTITIDPSQREELFAQLHKFADKHGLEFAFTDYGTNGARFLVEILGKDIKILAVDIPKAPTMVSIRFYDQSLATPVADETFHKIDDLASD